MDGYLKRDLLHEHSSNRLFIRRHSLSPSQVSLETANQRSGFKPKSPIRQSFRNLISAFKRSTSKNKTLEDVPVHRSDPPTIRPIRRKVVPRLPSLERNQTGRTSASSNAPATLWYLCQDPDKLMDSSPWVPCDAVVGTDKIAVTWISALGTPVGHNIDLTRCSDVRSLSFDQLESREGEMLMQRGEEHDFKVFEILFEGKAREKFATVSVRQRAGWISAIWDSVLSHQNAQRLAYQDTAPPTVASLSGPNLEPGSGYKPVGPVPRSLPVIPTDQHPTEPIILAPVGGKKLGDSPDSPTLALSEQGPESKEDGGSTTRSLSVFRKQRSQPLEQTSSECSQSSVTTRTSRFSQSTCVTTPDAGSLSGEKYAIMARTGSNESSNTAHSIIDAYRRDASDLAVSECPSSQQGPVLLFTTRSRLETIAESLNNLSIQDEEFDGRCSRPHAEGHHTSEVMVHLAQTLDANHELTTLVHRKLDNFLTEYADSSGTVIGGLKDIREKLAEPGIPVRRMSGATVENLSPPSNVVDSHQLELLYTRLDEILSVCQSHNPKEALPMQRELANQLSKIIKHIREDKARREVIAEQQNESVRYLNELNQWFESFVQDGASRFQGLSAGIDRLGEVLCETDDRPGLLAEIRQMNQCQSVGMEKTEELQHAVANLKALVNQNTESSTFHHVAQLLERHSQEQGNLVRMLARDISEEIRGERLRFVEAMKEATAINVQGHVEQFKEELQREVRAMNEEVGRLHQARQAMQNQIADLFGFYNRQPRVTDIPVPSRGTSIAQQENRQQHRIPRASQFRPLPYPRAP